LLQGALAALKLIACAAVLGVLVHRLTLRVPWPHPFRLRFVLTHVVAAIVYAMAWIVLDSLVEGAARGELVIAIGPGIEVFLITGVWLYVMVAGVAYAFQAAERESQLKLLAARSQLSMLRAQLHPHFLFNALHTVVQLIPIDHRAAVRAAEQLAGLLRTTLEENRDVVPLAEEWALVQRYLAIESIRFGERLKVESAIDDETLADTLPSFALQTLVENAVRHAAAPAATATTLKITTRREGRVLHVEVADSGVGASQTQLEQGGGTGLPRLRERLATLYDGAQLVFRATVPQGVTASLHVPQPDYD
jgi:LytS/YehU family sensor histidine kinase